jgi:hypothetical protein
MTIMAAALVKCMIRTANGCNRLGAETVPFAVVALTLATRPDVFTDTMAGLLPPLNYGYRTHDRMSSPPWLAHLRLLGDGLTPPRRVLAGREVE